MPSKYSHSVVLADYSARDFISQSNGKPWDFQKPVVNPALVPHATEPAPSTAERAPSACSSQNRHSVILSISTDNSESPRRYSTPRNNRRSASHERDHSFDGDRQVQRLQPTTRRVIINAHSSKVDGLGDELPKSKSASLNRRSYHAATSNQTHLPRERAKSVGDSRVNSADSIARHASLASLTAQKYEPKSMARAHNQRAMPISREDEPSQDDVSGRRLSMREFLTFSEHHAPTDGRVETTPQLADTKSATDALPKSLQVTTRPQTPERKLPVMKFETPPNRRDSSSAEKSTSEIFTTPQTEMFQESNTVKPSQATPRQRHDPLMQARISELDFGFYDPKQEVPVPVPRVSAAANISAARDKYVADPRTDSPDVPTLIEPDEMLTVQTEPDLSRYTENEELEDLMRRIYVQANYLNSTGMDFRGIGPSPHGFLPGSLQSSNEQNDDILPWSGTSMNALSTPSRNSFRGSRKQRFARGPPNASSSLDGSPLAMSPVPRNPVPKSTTHISNFGVLSVVRAPEAKVLEHRRNLSQQQSWSVPGTAQKDRFNMGAFSARLRPLSRGYGLDSILSSRSRKASTEYLRSVHGDEDDFDMPAIPINLEKRTSQSEILESQATTFGSWSRSGPAHRSVTPTLQRLRRSQMNSLASQRRPPPSLRGGPSLLTVYDDVVSISSAGGFAHGVEADEDLSSDDEGTHELEQRGPLRLDPEDLGNDPDAALPPPNISRYPHDRSSLRSHKRESYRLSSLTSASINSVARKMTRKSRAAKDKDDTAAKHYRDSGSGVEDIFRALHRPRTPSGQPPRTAESRTRSMPVFGVKYTTGERLENILKAEDEIKAKTGIKGVWSRLKHRITS